MAGPWVAPEDDLALVDRARNGDLGAFESLYRRHVGRVYGLCLRLAGERARAEELTQEAFVRAWRKLGSFRGESAFETWLFRLTANLGISRLRQRKTLDARLVPIDDAPVAGLAGVVGKPHLVVDLERAIGKLPAGARTVFVLHDVEGYAHEEIAAMVGIAVGTSKAQLHRARRLLRGVLQ